MGFPQVLQKVNCMKSKNLLFAICLLFVGIAFFGCNSGNSAVVGKWKDSSMNTVWTFYEDGSFKASRLSLTGKQRVNTGTYRVKGKKLILDSNDDGEHCEFTWSKSDKNHIQFGSSASGIWYLERVN